MCLTGTKCAKPGTVLELVLSVLELVYNVSDLLVSTDRETSLCPSRSLIFQFPPTGDSHPET